jgi:hypothetical protein
MNLNKILLIVIVLLVIFGAWANWPSDKASVEVTPAPKAEGFVRPVREGNCWRQFIGVGTKDSVLVCG